MLQHIAEVIRMRMARIAPIAEILHIGYFTTAAGVMHEVHFLIAGTLAIVVTLQFIFGEAA